MPRHHRATRHRQPPGATPSPSEAVRRDAPKPNPPRPNRAFLAIAVVLLLIWMGFLTVMALLVRS